MQGVNGGTVVVCLAEIDDAFFIGRDGVRIIC